MKRFVFLIIGCFAFIAAMAQKKQNVYFFKNDVAVLNKDSADLIRIIQEPDSGSTLFNVLEFYHDSNRKSLGKVSRYEPRLVYEGQLMSFYENGKRKAIEQYADGFLSGNNVYYFENGKIEASYDYSSNGFSSVENKLLYQADSSGVVMVKDGNGHSVRKAANGSQEEGDYKDGKRNGLWTMQNPVAHTSYSETYDQGQFVKGTSVVDGVTYNYTQIEEPPSFPGGIALFYSKITKYLYSLKVLEESHRSGKVFVGYVIEADGTLSEVKIMKSLSPGLDKIALDVIKYSPTWLPGRQHGIPVRVKFAIPINFE
jgi:hypothetical protein